MLTLLPDIRGINVRFFGKDERIPDEPCARLEQVHGAKTVRVFGAVDASEKADGMTTDRTGLALRIRVADCQNFAVYDSKRHVLGALHAGWRGLVAGAIEEHFAVLHRIWGTDPRDTYVVAGPSLCARCAEFSDPQRELPGIDSRFFAGRLVDLQAIADDKLRSIGVDPARMARHPDCTRCNPEIYWSYRADPANVASGKHNHLVCCLHER